MNSRMKVRGGKIRFWAKISLMSCMLGLVFTGSGAAFDYPSRAIQVVVGYAPGGPASLGARLVSEEVSKEIGVPLVIINKPGLVWWVAKILRRSRDGAGREEFGEEATLAVGGRSPAGGAANDSRLLSRGGPVGAEFPLVAP